MDVDKSSVLLENQNSELTELVNITEICRLCANQNDKLVGIYSEEGESNSLAIKMNSYLPIKVDKTDELPLQCCWQCASTILAWHELVVTSIEADRRLRNSPVVTEKPPEPSAEISQFEDESKLEKSSNFEAVSPEGSSSSDEEMQPASEFKKRNQEYLRAVDLITISCIACERSFKTKTKLKHHMESSHKLKPTKVRRKKGEINAEFVCSVCKKGFTRKFDMHRHIANTHPNSINLLETSSRKKNMEFLNRHKVIGDGAVYYKCDLCEIKLTKSSSFMDHYNIHLDRKLHCCYLCGKKFRRSSHVTRHINIVHHGCKKFECEYCNELFASKYARDEHLNTHTNYRPYMCDICGKSFKQSASLYIHKMFHTDEFRFSCKVCGKKFKRLGELKKHETVHTDKRDYFCDVCQKAFKLGHSLKRHKKIHNT